jgi:hypothetical protein
MNSGNAKISDENTINLKIRIPSPKSESLVKKTKNSISNFLCYLCCCM